MLSIVYLIHCWNSDFHLTQSLFNKHQTQTTPETGRNLLLKMWPETFFCWLNDFMSMQKCKAWTCLKILRVCDPRPLALAARWGCDLYAVSFKTCVAVDIMVNTMNTCTISFHTRKTTGTEVLTHTCKFPIYIYFMWGHVHSGYAKFWSDSSVLQSFMFLPPKMYWRYIDMQRVWFSNDWNFKTTFKNLGEWWIRPKFYLIHLCSWTNPVSILTRFCLSNSRGAKSDVAWQHEKARLNWSKKLVQVQTSIWGTPVKLLNNSPIFAVDFPT